MIEQEFRNTIKSVRKKKHLTQIEVAEMAGVYEHCISEYEKGTHTPTLWRAEDILNSLGLRLAIVPME